MLEIVFIRHGESVGNKENRFRGRHDFPLNDNGLRQAHALAKALESSHFSAFYSSPLSRASKTAQILAAGKQEIIFEEAFNNISLGPWENRSKKEIQEQHPDLWKIWTTEPEKLDFAGMETLAQVQQRSFAGLQRLVEKHDQGSIAVVTHRAVLKPLFAAMLQMRAPWFWKIQIDTAAYCIAEYTNRGFTFTVINQNRHLQEFTREDLG
ncbi:MAG: histidine phosphatase family protein [Calditrichia bacterium]